MKRARRFLFRLLAALTAGVVALTAGALWLVTTGPVSLGFLTPYIEEALTFPDAGYRVTFSDIVLAWGGWRRTLELRALDVRVVGPDGAVLAQAPEIAVMLSARALLVGDFAPTRVDLLRPQLRLVRYENDRFGLGDAPGQLSRADAMLPVLLSALARQPLPGSPLSHLSRVGVAEATVWIEDRVAGTEWFVPLLEATVSRRAAGVSAELSLILALEGGSVVITATADYSDVPGILTIAAGFNDLNVATLFGTVTPLGAVATVDVLVDGTVGALVTRDGKVSRVDFDLTSGRGVIEAPTIWKDPVAFDSIAVRGTALDSLRSVRIDDFFVTQRGASAEGSGLFTFAPPGLGFVVNASWTNVPADRMDAMWPVNVAPKSRLWVVTNVRSGVATEGSLHMRVEPGEFSQLPQRGEVDLRFSYANGAATYLDDQPELVEARGSARLTTHTFELTVDAGRVGGIVVTEGAVHIDGLETDEPQMVVELVASGRSAEALRILALPPLSLDLPQGFGGAMAARVRFALPISSDIRPEQVKYAAAANLRDVNVPTGSPLLTLSGGSLAVRADADGAEAQGTILVNGTPMTVDFRQPLGNAAVAAPTLLTASGVVDDQGRRRLGFDTGSLMQGPVSVVARLELVGSVLRRGTVDLDLQGARLDLPGPGWDKPAGEAATANLSFETAADGTLRLPSVLLETAHFGANGQATIDLGAATAMGSGAINGRPIDLAWKWGGAPGAGRLSATMQADDGVLAEFGYSIAPWITGPVRVAAEMQTAGIGAGAARIALDLREAVIAVPGYQKPAGEDGFAEVALVPEAGTYRVRSFAATAPSLAVAGTVDMEATPAQGVQRVQLARLVLGETNVSATIERQANGIWQVAAKGERLDVRPFLAVTDAGEQPLLLPAMQVAGKFDSILIGDGRVLYDVAGGADFVGGVWRSLDAMAYLSNGASVAVVIGEAEQGQEGQYFVLTSTDAGAFFATIGLFQGAIGGALDVSGKIRQEGGLSLEGVVHARDFNAVRAPALAQVLSVASLTGIVDALQGNGIPFTSFESPFRWSGDGLTLGTSRAVGPAIGVTVEGNVSRNAVNLSGTIAPVNLLNQILGGIPLLGDMLVGEGLFAINYRVSGGTAAPVVTVNPLSALALGRLRELFFPN